MFGAVAGVTEGLVAAWMLAHIWLLPCVAAQVNLQVLQTGEGLLTAIKLDQTYRHRATLYWFLQQYCSTFVTDLISDSIDIEMNYLFKNFRLTYIKSHLCSTFIFDLK